MASVVPENPEACRGIGDLAVGRSNDHCVEAVLGGLSYLASETIQGDENKFWSGLLCILAAGTVPEWPEQDDPQPIKAVLEALTPEKSQPGGCNDGFARPAAPLLVLLFTNADQAPLQDPWSPMPQGWGSDLVMLRGPGKAYDRIGVVTIVGPDILADPGVCQAAAPEKLLEFSDIFDPMQTRRYDICSLKHPDKCQANTDDALVPATEFLEESLRNVTCAICGGR
ncbi:hypothetical protein [Nannocystis sp.]|uniref:hypothetical protein n=1 Tax=Nannocystis sp. TaxID=1962667 RepID=UPI0025DFE0DB|nr:hypothetical protein [Nannocystis sp.]MBK7827989.1 hypothetical protein [Nannocystis sp.]